MQQALENPLVSDKPTTTDRTFAHTFGPKNLEAFIGQEEIKRPLAAAIGSARARNEALDHILMYGPPGTGKTTLAAIAADGACEVVSCSVANSTDRLTGAMLRARREKAKYVVLDEVHALTKRGAESIYSLIDEGTMGSVIGTQTGFTQTLIGTTTEPDKMPAPLRERFGIQVPIRFYREDEIAAIVLSYSSKVGLSVDEAAARVIAGRSRGTPRIATRLIRRIRDFFPGGVSIAEATKAMDLWQVYEKGLTKMDLDYLSILTKRFMGGPVGVKNIAAAMGLTPGTLEGAIEPYLVRMGLVMVVHGGRVRL